MSRCVIISAAPVKDYKRLKSFINDDDFIISCDAGLKHCKKLNLTPSLITGDFDSASRPRSGKYSKIETIVLPSVKDDTDTFYAVKEGLRRGFDDFVLAGVIGNRFDHSLCNVSALLYLFNRGCKALAIDDFSTMRITGSRPDGTYTEEKIGECSYFSLMNITGDAEGVTIKNAKYCLEEAVVKAEFALGVSNENLPGKNAQVTVKKGQLLLIEVF